MLWGHRFLCNVRKIFLIIRAIQQWIGLLPYDGKCSKRKKKDRWPSGSDILKINFCSSLEIEFTNPWGSGQL